MQRRPVATRKDLWELLGRRAGISAILLSDVGEHRLAEVRLPETESLWDPQV